MSLFKTKEWWRTACGANETFDRRCLLVTPLFGEEKKDVLVVGSHDGYLRIYSPSSQWIEETKSPSNYKSTDSMIETRIGDCIVDIQTGKFVSGSQDLRLAVLISTKLIVYNATLADSSTEYGDRCDLKVAYEHPLPRHPVSLTTGPFGGVRGRDFLCVQCLDGTLLFYEQEMFAFKQVLKNRLLPEPIVYVPRNDLFVTSSTSWLLECYRYQSMAEWMRSDARRGSEDSVVDDDGNDGDDRQPRVRGRAKAEQLEPDWTFNIGEAILDIQAVTLSSFEMGIVVLGERHLYCLRDNYATIKYAKRLEYKPLCCRAYVIEPDGRLMVIVVADTSTLMIYEGTRLKWSAQLPFAPVTIARAHHLQHLQGAIVALSDDGRLEVCYLGAEPGLFVAPPLHSRGYDYAAAENQLAELRAILKRTKSSDDRSQDATMETELIVSLNVSSDLEVLGRSIGNDEGDDDDRKRRDDRPLGCKVAVELSSYANLLDVQICVEVRKPLMVTRDFQTIPNLRSGNVKTSVKIYIFVMVKFTNEQRLEIIKNYYRNSESVVATLRALTPIFGRNNRPTRQAVRAIVDKFESTYSLLDVPVPVRQRTGRSTENIAAVRASVQNEPNQSIPRRAQELRISQTTLWRILRKDLGVHPYKIKLTQELKPFDHLKRRNFSDWALLKFEETPEFHRKIIFSDEAHFWLNGFVNKQNMRYWTATNPHVLQKTPLQPQKVTVWCAFHAGGVIGPYFFVDENDRHVTVNGDRYRAMLEEYFWQELDGLDISDMWFQQDGATCHTANQTIDLLKAKFGNRVISRNGPVEWPPRSCDLTPLDFFLWGYVKSLVYANKPTTLEELRDNIEREIANVPADMCERVMENWLQRIDRCKRARGGHMDDIEFHS